MQDSFVVRSFNAGADLFEQRMRALHSHRALASQQLIERFAFDVFHDEEEDTFFALAEVSYVDHIRMLNRCRSARFPFESRDGFAFLKILIRKDVGTNRLDRDATRDQVLITREINLTHRPATQTLL